ncbi:hypothetical protein [Streptomyces sp. NPDC058629]|uniref:hypothetical protein n=1 Tax=Streptomyces sp. NPDC058629 TaxID=3346565 RepID=UPI003650DF1D
MRVVNVKPASRLKAPKVAQALAWPGHLIERHGWEYEIWSGVELAPLENVRFLAAYRHPGVVPVDEVERAWQEVVDGEELALAERRLAGDREREESGADGPAVVGAADHRPHGPTAVRRMRRARHRAVGALEVGLTVVS